MELSISNCASILRERRVESRGNDGSKFAFIAKGEDELRPRNYFLQVKVELEQFLFYIQPVITLRPDMLPAVAELVVARGNSGMRIGNFEVYYKPAKSLSE